MHLHTFASTAPSTAPSTASTTIYILPTHNVIPDCLDPFHLRSLYYANSSFLSRCLCYQGLFVCGWFECETWVHSAHRSVLTLTDPPLHLAYLKGPSQYQSMRPPLYSPRCKFHSGPPQRRSNRAILTTDDRTVIVERGGIYRYTD
jgi:hypothetical protein